MTAFTEIADGLMSQNLQLIENGINITINVTYIIQQILMISSSMRENVIFYLLLKNTMNFFILLAKLVEYWLSTN